MARSHDDLDRLFQKYVSIMRAQPTARGPKLDQIIETVGKQHVTITTEFELLYNIVDSVRTLLGTADGAERAKAVDDVRHWLAELDALPREAS